MGGLRSATMAGGTPVELKPDIRLVIASFHAGGSERVCLRLANAWAAQGFCVELLLVRRKGPYLALLDPRVRILSPDASRTLRALPWIRRQLRRWPAVPALLFGFDLGVGLGAMKRLGILPVPLIYREGSLPTRNIPSSAHWRYGALIGGVDGVIAQSKVALDSLRNLGLNALPGAVIWNPVQPPGSPVDAPSRVPFARGVRFLAVGRISPEKGLLRLVRAFRHLRTSCPEAVLEIAGEGPQQTEIQAAIASLGLNGLVQMTGLATNLAELYSRADVLLLASHYEGQPNVVFEALSHGCRVAVAGGPAVAEVMETLHLSECVIAEGDFAVELAAAVQRGNDIPAARWHQALKDLAALTNPEPVSAAYLEFCLKVARAEQSGGTT
jgi:glycosyltransferase involved in cell wall biosynthesis